MDICSTRALNEQGSPCSNLTKGQREAKEWNIFKKEKKNHQTGKQLLTYRPKSSCKGKGGGGWGGGDSVGGFGNHCITFLRGEVGKVEERVYTVGVLR